MHSAKSGGLETIPVPGVCVEPSGMELALLLKNELTIIQKDKAVVETKLLL